MHAPSVDSSELLATGLSKSKEHGNEVLHKTREFDCELSRDASDATCMSPMPAISPKGDGGTQHPQGYHQPHPSANARVTVALALDNHFNRLDSSLDTLPLPKENSLPLPLTEPSTDSPSRARKVVKARAAGTYQDLKDPTTSFSDFVLRKVHRLEQRMNTLEQKFDEYNRHLLDQITEHDSHKERWCKGFTDNFMTVLESHLTNVRSGLEITNSDIDYPTPTDTGACESAACSSDSKSSFKDAYQAAIQAADLLNKHLLPIDLMEDNVEICSKLVERLDALGLSSVPEMPAAEESTPSLLQRLSGRLQPVMRPLQSQSDVYSEHAPVNSPLKYSCTDLNALVVARERSRQVIEEVPSEPEIADEIESTSPRDLLIVAM